MSFGLGLDLSFGLSRIVDVPPTPVLGVVNENGGTIRDGEVFTIYNQDGGLSTVSSVQLVSASNVVDLTINQIIDDFNMTVTAPSNSFLFSDSYSLKVN